MPETDPAINKLKLTAAQQIESMKSNGISFDILPEERAEEFLKRRNYFLSPTRQEPQARRGAHSS